MADEDTVLEEAMDKESRKLRWAAHQGNPEPHALAGYD
jgi:hypothetical protein